MKRTLTCLLLLAGCGGDAPPADGNPPSADGNPQPAASSASCDGMPKSQGPSQPCCQGYGIDACGAGLFCAAFDGRTQATCYANYSRDAGQTCSADAQCQTESCNTTAHVCRPTDGKSGRACSSDVDCLDELVCTSGHCEMPKAAAGTVCTSDDQCASGACASCGAHYASCFPVSLSGTGRCLAADGRAGSYCYNNTMCASGRCVRNPFLEKSQCSGGGEWDTCDSLGCAQGTCLSLVTSGPAFGICRTGNQKDEPCNNDSDCASNNCQMPADANDWAGSACG
jgi:hypothetical protein